MQSKVPSEYRHASFHGRVGVARVDITPPIGIFARNWGAAKHDVVDSIHRPLTLTALVVSDVSNKTQLVYLDADLGWFKTPQTFQRLQNHLLESLSVKPANLIFALSHTHSAPPMMEPDDSLPGNEIHQVWMKSLFESAVQVVRTARTAMFEATIDWNLGHCELASVRDFPDPNPRKRESSADTILPLSPTTPCWSVESRIPTEKFARHW